MHRRCVTSLSELDPLLNSYTLKKMLMKFHTEKCSVHFFMTFKYSIFSIILLELIAPKCKTQYKKELRINQRALFSLTDVDCTIYNLHLSQRANFRIQAIRILLHPITLIFSLTHKHFK